MCFNFAYKLWGWFFHPTWTHCGEWHIRPRTQSLTLISSSYHPWENRLLNLLCKSQWVTQTHKSIWLCILHIHVFNVDRIHIRAFSVNYTHIHAYSVDHTHTHAFSVDYTHIHAFSVGCISELELWIFCKTGTKLLLVNQC